MASQIIRQDCYYQVTSDLSGPSAFLNTGANSNLPGAPGEAPGPLSFSQVSYSSDNWQFFYQAPVFLIRNYAYGAGCQLGITGNSPNFPALLPASEELAQQWNITMWDDGTYKLSNMALGSSQVIETAFWDNRDIPVMNAGENGSHWSLGIIPSVSINGSSDMLQPVSLEAAPSSTSTLTSLLTSTLPSSPSSLSSGTLPPGAAGTVVVVTTVTAGSFASSSNSASSKSPTPVSISYITITGISVVTVASALVALGLWLFTRRRKRQRRDGYQGRPV